MNRTLRQGMPFLSFGVLFSHSDCFTAVCFSRFMLLLVCFVSVLYRR